MHIRRVYLSAFPIGMSLAFRGAGIQRATVLCVEDALKPILFVDDNRPRQATDLCVWKRDEGDGDAIKEEDIDRKIDVALPVHQVQSVRYPQETTRERCRSLSVQHCSGVASRLRFHSIYWFFNLSTGILDKVKLARGLPVSFQSLVSLHGMSHIRR